MDKSDYLKWLKEWFIKNTGLPIRDVYQNIFIQEGLDSFKTLQLITEIETTYRVCLNDTIFNDPRFSSLDGLAEILSEIDFQ